ncbi:MAG: phenylalanine--tRNA ligase subunit alpha, partial [Candidatus Omnitrophica bacterium]|nr:phenylalanine--tRNA ligase subunit alpha [Candidatus Omnitrophota bacterium]
MTFDYETEKQNSRQKIAEAGDARTLEAVRVEYLGRKGKLAAMYANLAVLSKEEKPEAGKRINEFRNIVTQLIEEKKKQITAKVRQDSQKQLDVTI